MSERYTKVWSKNGVTMLCTDEEYEMMNRLHDPEKPEPLPKSFQDGLVKCLMNPTIVDGDENG